VIHKAAIIKTLYYFSYDLSDENLPENIRACSGLRSGWNAKYAAQSGVVSAPPPGVHEFIATVRPEKFADHPAGRFRASLQTILPSEMTVDLFGNYSRTIYLFTHKYQADLKTAYEAQKPKHPFRFRIGYNLVHSGSEYDACQKNPLIDDHPDESFP